MPREVLLEYLRQAFSVRVLEVQDGSRVDHRRLVHGGDIGAEDLPLEQIAGTRAPEHAERIVGSELVGGCAECRARGRGGDDDGRITTLDLVIDERRGVARRQRPDDYRNADGSGEVVERVAVQRFALGAFDHVARAAVVAEDDAVLLAIHSAAVAVDVAHTEAHGLRERDVEVLFEREDAAEDEERIIAGGWQFVEVLRLGDAGRIGRVESRCTCRSTQAPPPKSARHWWPVVHSPPSVQ